MIVASDLEGTLTTGETWRGLRAYLLAHNHAASYQRFARRMLPLYLAARVGVVNKRAFQNRWIAELMTVVSGQMLGEFQRAASWVVEHELLPKARTAVLERLTQAKAQGSRVILASGTYQPVLEAFAARFGFEAVGTPLEVVGNKLTGRLAGEVNVGTVKLERLRAHIGNDTLETAYGDTMSDVPMLEAARTAFVVAGNDARLETMARARGWTIVY